jgi:hypothetical protein
VVTFDSSAIWRAEYDPDEQLMLLWFTGDALPYGYRNVPESMFEALCSAESQGRFFAAHIRDQFETMPPPEQ